MNKSYDYVAPDYRIRFGTGGDWFSFEHKGLAICGDLKDGDWEIYTNDPHPNYRGPGYCYSIDLDELPYETLVLFRKALAIKGLEYVLDKEITLVEEK